jgi:hypothetical protein
MALTIQNAASIQAPWTHWFFYGESRAGKTTAAATFPRPLFLVPNQERSHIALMGRADVDFVLVKGMADMVEALDEVASRYNRADLLWRKGDDASNAKAAELFPWETVVVESITHYADLLQEEFTDGGRFEMTWEKWGKLGGHLRNLHSRLRNLPVHVVFTSLENRVYAKGGKDGEKKLIEGGPLFPGKMSYKLPSACDGIVFFERRAGNPNPVYNAHLVKHEVFLAGVRFPQLGALKKLTPFRFSEVQKYLGG